MKLLPLALALMLTAGLAFAKSPATPKAPKPPKEPAPLAEPFVGDITDIKDGDTLTVLAPDGLEATVRLYGVDAPEMKQAFGPWAKEYVTELAIDRQVQVVPQTTDRYGRLVAEVILPDGRVLSREMVIAGLAWWYQIYAPDAAILGELERTAREGKAGLWCDPNPVAPWDFRKRDKGKHDK